MDMMMMGSSSINNDRRLKMNDIGKAYGTYSHGKKSTNDLNSCDTAVCGNQVETTTLYSQKITIAPQLNPYQTTYHKDRNPRGNAQSANRTTQVVILRSPCFDAGPKAKKNVIGKNNKGDDDPADSDADAICSEHSSDSEVSSLSSQDENDQDETFGGNDSNFYYNKRKSFKWSKTPLISKYAKTPPHNIIKLPGI
ncbi:hypothetical protein FQA39_LY16127 [Lamprigera yunnana]|nr:hypothetical protein FQA39_LY16127 [Lamprigera yunnana]